MSEALLDLQAVPTDRYPLIRVICHTKFAFTAVAHDTEASESVFIKARDAEIGNNSLRLEREALILGEFSHPQIPRLVEADTSESQPTPYVISKFKGGSIYPRQWLKAYSYPQLAARICLSALQPLSYSHEQRVAHRDVSMSNLAIGFGGEAALLDFELGLGDDQPDVADVSEATNSHMSATSSRITSPGHTAGTADYISPERAYGKRGSVQSDIYSMGIVLYELLYGKLPFDGGLAVVVANKHCALDIDLSDTDRAIPETLKRVVEIATQKIPTDRYDSASAMSQDVELYLRGCDT